MYYFIFLFFSPIQRWIIARSIKYLFITKTGRKKNFHSYLKCMYFCKSRGGEEGKKMIFFERGIESTISFIGIYFWKVCATERYYLTNRFNVVNFCIKKGKIYGRFFKEKKINKNEISYIFSNNNFIPPSKFLNIKLYRNFSTNSTKLITFNKKKKKPLYHLFFIISFLYLERTTNMTFISRIKRRIAQFITE